MNRIVREHYPADRLPSDLREGLGAEPFVKVTIEQRTDDQSSEPRPTFGELFALLEKARKESPIGDDPVARIRALRDEWDR